MPTVDELGNLAWQYMYTYSKEVSLIFLPQSHIIIA